MEFRELLQVVRDVALVILAIETIVLGILALVVAFFVWRLVSLVTRSVRRITNLASDVLTTAGDTARDIKGTTAFVNDHAARPVIEVASLATAISRFARVFMGSDKNGHAN